VNPQTLELAHEIKSHGIRIAILSNMPPDLLVEMRKHFDWLDEFEVQIWSCEHGVIKPNPAIYRLCLDALGCDAERTLCGRRAASGHASPSVRVGGSGGGDCAWRSRWSIPILKLETGNFNRFACVLSWVKPCSRKRCHGFHLA
jgi:hypothetical protein